MNTLTRLAIALLAATAAACSTPEPDATPEPAGPDLAAALAEAEVPNASNPSPGLACAGQIDAAQMDALAAAGITRFISLRAADEKGSGWEEDHAAAAGHDFVRLEISGKDAINALNAAALRREIDLAEGPVLVYCGSSNRVGTLVGLGAHGAGEATKEEALDLARRAGMTRLEPVLVERLGGE